MKKQLTMLLVGAAMIALPSASAFANKDEVVVLMCIDSNVNQAFGNPDPNSNHFPTVFKREASFDPLPEECGSVFQSLGLDCAACLRALINAPYLCEADLGFPQSPVLTRASDGLIPTNGEEFSFPINFNVVSYAMQCESQ